MNSFTQTTPQEMARMLKQANSLDLVNLRYWALRGADTIIALQYKVERLQREKIQEEMAKEILEIRIKELEEVKTIDSSTFTLESKD